MVGIELVDKYTNFYYRQMRDDGYSVDREEIASELGLVYAKALQRVKKGAFKGQGEDNFATATFKTYCIRGFSNQICSLKRRIIERAAETSMQVKFNENHIYDERGLMADDACIGEEAKVRMLRLFDGMRQAIAGELIEPSEAVLGAIRRFESECCLPDNLRKGRTAGSLPKAIAEIYGVSEWKARYEIKKIKETIKKALTS